MASALTKPSHGATWKADGSDNLVAAPLTSGSHPNSNAPGRRKEDDENLVATSITLASDPISAEELAQPSTRRNGDPGVVQRGAMVRRLTPTECERLQALPDGWTNPTGDAPDSRRYAALGDAVTASVGEWIGRRLIAADQETAA